MYKTVGKRLLDFLAAVTLLVALSPVLFIVSILLFIVNDRKVFFYQQRPGKHEKVFSIIKFKTMTDATDEDGNLLLDKDRLTPVGKFVRKASIDEIPQLINVLKGEMSLIGPRPLLIRYLPYYNAQEQKRHSVLPGITGLAQVSGRNMLNWDDRLAKDKEYVENISFLLDLKIFFLTIKNVMSSKDTAIDPQSLMLDLDEYREKA
ncbi:sugar transferase [Muriicola sp. Z0-33]|uniref:sugar transferase n=1 Tax=Muriicola sp. Z0-33 TaxID=2816957 RepID=UPI002237150D|nr:sugar transferase [Muriicola sp. Z0-33]MCW5515609.1 sugar transferase [Muriicola sp. Z0-33]